MPEPEPSLLTLEELRSDPVFNTQAEPPARPNLSHLNWSRISWQNFERLCLRLIEKDPSVESPRLYGRQGQDQQGIDLYARNPKTGRYVVYQCKRVKSFSSNDFKELGDEFFHIDPKTGEALPLTDEEGQDLKPPWQLTETYVLCLTLKVENYRLELAWTNLQKRLGAHGIHTELWDYERIERQLKKYPEIVLDFFGLEWVRAFNGPEAAAKYEDRVGHADVQQLQALIIGLDEKIQNHGLTPDLQQMLVRFVQQVPIQIQEPAGPNRNPFDEGLERLRTLIDVGAFLPAQEEVAKLELQLGDASPAQHATLLRMKGNLLYRQHLPGASACLHQAFDLDASVPAAKVFKGMAFLLDGQPGHALGYLDQARRENADREDAMSLYTIAVSELGDEAELARLEASLTPEDRGIAFHLARHYASAMDSAAVRRIMARLDDGPYANDPHKRLLEAKADLLQLYGEANGMHNALREHALAQRPEVQRILDVTEAILPALEDPREPRALVPEALNIRQVLYTLIGNDIQALEAGRHALRLDPSQHGVRLDVSLNELRLKRPVDALQTIETGGDETLDALPAARIIKAAALRHLGRHEDALSALQPLLTPEDELRVRALDECVLALLALDRVDEARQVVDGIPLDEVAVHLARANVETAAQNDAAVRLAYEAAMQVAGPSDLSLTRMLYAQYLHGREDDAGVLAQLQALNLNELPSPWLENALTYFERAGDGEGMRTALQIVDERGEAHFDSTLQIATELAISEGDLPQAGRRVKTILERSPKHSRTRLMLAAIQTQTGQKKACQVALQALWAEQILSPEEQRMAARIATRNGQDELARAFAYQAWRVLRDYRSHEQFANLMLRLPDDPEPKTVEGESAVKLNAAGHDAWWIVITRDPTPDNSRGEFAFDDPLSTTLLGKTRGNTVQVGQINWTISDILTKYMHAAKTYFGQGEQLYPHDYQFRRFQTDELRLFPEGMWDDLQRRNDLMRKLADNVRQFRAPVLSLHTGRFTTETEFWEAVSADRLELPTYLPWLTQRLQATEVVDRKDLLLHTSALIYLARLRLLRPLMRSHQVVVTRQTLDDLKSAVREVQTSLRRMPLKTMSAEGGRISIHEEKEATTRARASFLERLEKLVRKSARIVPVRGMYEATEGHEQGGRMDAMISAALGSSQHAIPVVCDDLYFAVLADNMKADPPAQFITSLALAEQLVRGGKWTAEQGRAARVAFLGLGHTVVPLGVDELNDVLALEDTSFGPLTQRAVRNLTHPVFTVTAATRYLAQFYRSVFSLTTLPLTQERWLGRALEIATIDRDGLAFCTAFLAAVDSPFHLLAWRVPEIQEWVLKWERERLPSLSGARND